MKPVRTPRQVGLFEVRATPRSAGTSPLPTPHGPWTVFLGVRLTNPLNGATGHSRLQSIIRSNERKKHRSLTRDLVSLQVPIRVRQDFAQGMWRGLLAVQITRISAGKLDAWDGLPAALKPVVDGIADAFGVRDDDPRWQWLPPKQEKQGRGVFGVRIELRWEGA